MLQHGTEMTSMPQGYRGSASQTLLLPVECQACSSCSRAFILPQFMLLETCSQLFSSVSPAQCHLSFGLAPPFPMLCIVDADRRGRYNFATCSTEKAKPSEDSPMHWLHQRGNAGLVLAPSQGHHESLDHV